MSTNPSALLESDLYEQDYQSWLEHQAVILRAGRFAELDRANLAEEIEDLAKRDRRALKSTLTVVLLHLLKYRFQPERRSVSWRATLIEHRQRIQDDFADSPSLRPYAAEGLADCYRAARQRAAVETELPVTTFLQTSVSKPMSFWTSILARWRADRFSRDLAWFSLADV